ncbi:hypothetical protein PHJA_000963700 [Phtheirospermum japonicum]|uniref:Uncharacterized protein n=1 Tax=Phtheirospermum japonicum TaxID=374723 RepID=A0A830BKT2_9LAMI|nr:hypothetical protein PHJA_000963700 [Phtheirospermum japonicum]
MPNVARLWSPAAQQRRCPLLASTVSSETGHSTSSPTTSPRPSSSPSCEAARAPPPPRSARVHRPPGHVPTPQRAFSGTTTSSRTTARTLRCTARRASSRLDRVGVGRSGQASSVIGAPLAALLSSPAEFAAAGPRRGGYGDGGDLLREQIPRRILAVRTGCCQIYIYIYIILKFSPSLLNFDS